MRIKFQEGPFGCGYQEIAIVILHNILYLRILYPVFVVSVRIKNSKICSIKSMESLLCTDPENSSCVSMNCSDGRLLEHTG